MQRFINRCGPFGRHCWASIRCICRRLFVGGVQMTWDATLWAGRKFRDNATGETLVIPDDVRAKQFFSWGESFIDVGDGVYSRCGGDFIELTGPVAEEDINCYVPDDSISPRSSPLWSARELLNTVLEEARR